MILNAVKSWKLLDFWRKEKGKMVYFFVRRDILFVYKCT